MANEALWKLVNVATAAHVAAYKVTGGRFLLGPLGASRTVLVDHVGRRSGTKRTTPLLYLDDGEDVVIVASKGGSHKHPAWWLNLREMGETEIQVGSEHRRVTVGVGLHPAVVGVPVYPGGPRAPRGPGARGDAGGEGAPVAATGRDLAQLRGVPEAHRAPDPARDPQPGRLLRMARWSPSGVQPGRGPGSRTLELAAPVLEQGVLPAAGARTA